MATTMELALSTLVLWLLAILDSVSCLPAVDTLVVLQGGSLALALLLVVP